MKYSILLVLIFALFSCSRSPKLYPKPVYDTSKQISVFYLIDPKLVKFEFVPAKRIIVHHNVQGDIDSTSEKDKIIVGLRPAIDTVYMIATIDSLEVMKDSTGKAVLDLATKLPIHPYTFRRPLYSPTSLTTETNILTFPATH
jgi:hypothetical protein